MYTSDEIGGLVDLILTGGMLERSQLVDLLSSSDDPDAVEAIFEGADRVARKVTEGHGEVHARIGLDSTPCAGNCLFCSFARQNHFFEEPRMLSEDEVMTLVDNALSGGVNAVHLVATGSYPQERYLELLWKVSRHVDGRCSVVADMGDISEVGSRGLLMAGASGVYHSGRLGEGRYTSFNLQKRLNTMRFARADGMPLMTAVEPVGPEHGPAEVADRMALCRDLSPDMAGLIHRVSIQGTSFEGFGMLTPDEIGFATAVLRLALGWTVKGISSLSATPQAVSGGANILWSVLGPSPWDTEADITEHEGYEVSTCRRELEDAGYVLEEGPSRYLGGGEE